MIVRILSVCTNLPTRNQPQRGLFVHRRLEMLSKQVPLRALNPQVWFPLVKPKTIDAPLETTYPIDIRPMFYLPGVAKRLDGMWMSRCVGAWLDSLPTTTTKDAVLDAHFGYPEGVGCARAAHKRGIPYFVTIRGLEVDLFQRPDIGPQLVAAIKGACHVIAVSEFLRQSAISAGVPSDQISVVGNGVDSAFYSPGEYNLSRNALGIPPNLKLIVSVGNLKQVKGHDVLLRALAEIPRECNVKLVCIGALSDAGWVKRLKQLILDLKVHDRVEFKGSLPPEHIVSWLRASDQFVLASRREGCCNAVLEALSVGVPVVATRVGDNSQYVREGFSGALVDAENHQLLAQAMLSTMQQTYSRERISQSMQAYSWKNAADRVIELIGNHA